MPRAIPAIRYPARNAQVLLTNRPAGVPQPGDFTLAEADLPRLDAGQILVRNIYLSADPAQRGWASAEANYSAPVPLGTPMRALAVGQVMESHADGFAAGDFVYGFFGWQDYAAVAPAAVLHKITEDVPLDAAASLLGINGVTAYLALTLLGRPVAGDTLVVSTAAGSVGSFVGQIGASLGATTIGLTGDDDKVRRCIASYGYAHAINYKTANLDAALRDCAPKGVNVYYDNTGGTILDTILRQMAIAGRVVQCGTASVGSWLPAPTGPRNEREILTRRLVWSGFVIFDHMGAYALACADLAAMWQAGKITYDTDISHGIEAAPGAIAALYSGANTGKKLIQIT
ncbi:MAG: NADP-dependent oxidoreductase [Gemmobacter sp.]|nr:NADP-dependent oxidoreductase [Gemmobacter sp.]